MSVATSSGSIAAAGSDTSTPLNLQKRIRLIADQVELKGCKLLDCGCGAGEYVLALCREGADAVGVEYSADKVAQFAAANPGNPRVQTGDIEHLNFASGSFDAALLNEVLEHVPDDNAALREVYRILKPGGTLLLFSPNRLYPFETHGVYLRQSHRRLPHYFPFVPYVPLACGRSIFNYWARNYWPGQLRDQVKAAGFSIRSHGFVWQTFENISGNQPALIRATRPLLRRVASTLEQLPGLRAFGVSQLIVATRA